MTKSELRKLYLGRQKALSSDERSEASRLVADRLFQSFDLGKVKILHCFISISKLNEIDTSLMFSRIWNELPRVETVVPRVNFESGGIESLRFTAQTELSKNIWHIDEPVSAEIVEAWKIDMALVPGLAFDQDGHRVGYGKGFYDRYLSKCRPDCLKVGLSLFEPVERISDTFAGDVRLTAIVSPHRIIDLRDSAGFCRPREKFV